MSDSSSKFVFCAYHDDLAGGTVVEISTRRDWEQEHRQSDFYTGLELRIIEDMCVKYGLSELMESSYWCGLSPEKITELLSAEPDFTFDQGFADFIDP